MISHLNIKKAAINDIDLWCVVKNSLAHLKMEHAISPQKLCRYSWTYYAIHFIHTTYKRLHVWFLFPFFVDVCLETSTKNNAIPNWSGYSTKNSIFKKNWWQTFLIFRILYFIQHLCSFTIHIVLLDPIFVILCFSSSFGFA